jgi:hypothetical protein
MVTSQYAQVVERTMGRAYADPPPACPTTTPGGSGRDSGDRGLKAGLGTKGTRSAPHGESTSWDGKSR